MACSSKLYGEINFLFNVTEFEDEIRELYLEGLEIDRYNAKIQSQFFNGFAISIFAMENNPYNIYPSSFQFIMTPYRKYYSVEMIDYGFFAGEEPASRESLECLAPEF